MLLDAELRAQWRKMAKLSAGPVVGAIRMCEEARTSDKYDQALYMGGEWAKALQACLVAWAATDSKDDAATAMRFFKALIDDLDVVGDGRGGNEAARRDHGYAIRFLGPYTALAYDWLHDHPLMTPELAARARERWAAWIDWYRDKGYRANSPGSNYHAGYLIAATMIAIAQAGEADDAGTALWQFVADQLWNKDMAAALSQEGVLAGGNWPEGWQYGPLSIAEIALGARVMREAGVDVPGIAPWLASVMRHHVYALTPSDRVFAGGDTLVAALFDARWATVAPMLALLSALSLSRPISHAVGSYLLAVGKTTTASILEVTRLVLLLVSMLVLGRLGPLWICAAVDWAVTTHAIVCLWVVSLDGVPLGATLRGLAPPLLACLPMAAAVYGVRYGLIYLGIECPLASLLLEIVLGAAVFVCSALVVARPIALDLVALAKDMIARRRGR
jgi:hypothetical protein